MIDQVWWVAHHPTAGEVDGLIQDNELFNAILGAVVLAFLIIRRRALRHFPESAVLISAYGFFFAAGCATVIEGVLWPSVFNIAEHVFYAISGVLLACWSWHALRRMGEDPS